MCTNWQKRNAITAQHEKEPGRLAKSVEAAQKSPCSARLFVLARSILPSTLYRSLPRALIIGKRGSGVPLSGTGRAKLLLDLRAQVWRNAW